MDILKIKRIAKFELNSLLGADISNNKFNEMVDIGELKIVEINGTKVTLDRRVTMTLVIFIEKDNELYMYVK